MKRRKDGKIHHYWSVVENVRVGKRVFQRRALYLGELNDSQHAEWQRAIEAVDDNGRKRSTAISNATDIAATSAATACKSFSRRTSHGAGVAVSGTLDRARRKNCRLQK